MAYVALTLVVLGSVNALTFLRGAIGLLVAQGRMAGWILMVLDRRIEESLEILSLLLYQT